MRAIIIIAATVLLVLPAAAGAADFDARFDHAAHLEASGAECSACHHEGDMDVVPAMERCGECHEKAFLEKVEIPVRVTHDSFWYVGHGPEARRAGRDCSVCHDDSACFDCHKAGFADEQGKINVHRSDFRVTHPIMARADQRSCSACHEAAFCVDCHDDFAPEELAFSSHRRSFSDIEATGTPHSLFTVDQCRICHADSVLPTHDWSGDHAREARRSLPTCQSCHPDGEVCLKCHSAREGLIVNPHPENWDDIEDVLNGASGGRTCRRCH